jgi:cell division protein FtsW
VLDSGIFPAALAILLIGLVMVASVSMPLAEKNFGNPLHYLIRQSQFAGLGLLAGLVVLQIKLSFWEKFSPLLLLGSTLLLIFVLFYGVEVKGASRWISFGAIKMQPSELAKISAFIYLSSYLVRHRKRVCIEFAAVIMPIGLLAIVSVLILLEPDLGAAVVLMVVVLIMMILAGVRTSQIVLFIALGLIAFYIAIKMEDYRWKRIVAYWNNDPLINIQIKENWQIGQSLLSFNNGGFSGVGLGEGLQKLFYLPDAHTDFILASIAEELGLIGTLSLLALFSFIVWKAFKLAQQAAAANLYFASYLAYGLGSWIGKTKSTKYIIKRKKNKII